MKCCRQRPCGPCSPWVSTPTHWALPQPRVVGAHKVLRDLGGRRHPWGYMSSDRPREEGGSGWGLARGPASSEALCPPLPPGPNEVAPFKPESELHELSTKLLLHYSPQVSGGGATGSTLLPCPWPPHSMCRLAFHLTLATCPPPAPRPVGITSAWTCPLAMGWMAA